MTHSASALESLEVDVLPARRLSRGRALMAILVLAAIAASSAAAVLMPAEASATSRGALIMSERQYRDAAAKSQARSGASHRGSASGAKGTSDPC